MKKINFILLIITVSLFVNCNASNRLTVTQAQEKTIFEKLAEIKNVVSIEKRNPLSHFNKNYEIWFEQPIDHNDLSKGTFRQRVFLGYKNNQKPVFVMLEGYGIYSEKAGELAKHYQANQLTVEHRYFNNSRPEEINWNTLTIENAAKDQAIIIDAIRKAIFPTSKFITNGISKGCQATMAHRSYFPNNVDGSVCYVGPLNFQREDPRVFDFLKNVGTPEEREQIKQFQNLCFENRADLLGILKNTAKEHHLSWEFGEEKAIDYTILEYSFAFWQWGNKKEDIPNKNASSQEIYNHLFTVSGYGFFESKSVDDLQPYFWAALTQQGIYGYETAPFKQYLHTEEVYNFDWAFPEGVTKEYDLKPMQEIKSFLDTSANKMIFIYGEYDAWSATAVDLKPSAKKRELYKFVKSKGSHTTRIKSFDMKDQIEIYKIINSWLVLK